MARSRMILLFAGAMLVAACGNTPQPSPAPEPEETVEAAAAAADPEVAAEDPDVKSHTNGGGRVIASYEDATTPEAINGRQILESAGLLEDLATEVNDMLVLPNDIPLVGAECGQANAFWSPANETMTICYELTDLSEKIFTEAGDPNPLQSALDATVATFYHELGHMAISVYDLPITGREEDVADQLSAYMLLWRGEDGQLDPDSVRAAIVSAREYRAYANLDGGQVDESSFADVHSLDETRSYNLLCWVYGADPTANAEIVTSGDLPQDRADGCQDEYNQLEYAWDSLLDPHFI